MNDKELNASKPASEEETQASHSVVESSVSGSEPQQPSSSSQPESCDVPSISSPEDENGTTGSETHEPSSGDKPVFGSPEPTSLSMADIKKRIGVFYESYTNQQRFWIQQTLAERRRLGLKQVQHPRVFEWEDSTIGRDLVYRLERALISQSSKERFLITNFERCFLEEVIRRPLYKILATKGYPLNFPTWLLSGPYPNGTLEMAMVVAYFASFIKVINSYCERFREISGACKLSPSIELPNSQATSSAFENEEHEPKTKREHIEPSEDYCETEACPLGDAMNDFSFLESPREAQSLKMELKSEMNVNDPNLDEDSSASETLDRGLANPSSQETPNVPPEESLEGTSAKKSKMM